MSQLEDIIVTGAGGERVPIPERLPLLPVRDVVVFPGVTRPLAIGRAQSLAALARAGQGGLLVVATQREAETEDPGLADLHPVACVVRVARIVDSRGDGKQAIVVGVARARVVDAVETEPCLMVRVAPLSEIDLPSPERDVAWKQVIAQAQQVIDLRDDLPDEWKTFVAGLPSPGLLTDLVASTLPLAPEEQIALLAEVDVGQRLARVLAHLEREVTIAETQRRADRAVGRRRAGSEAPREAAPPPHARHPDGDRRERRGLARGRRAARADRGGRAARRCARRRPSAS